MILSISQALLVVSSEPVSGVLPHLCDVVFSRVSTSTPSLPPLSLLVYFIVDLHVWNCDSWLFRWIPRKSGLFPSVTEQVHWVSTPPSLLTEPYDHHHTRDTWSWGLDYDPGDRWAPMLLPVCHKEWLKAALWESVAKLITVQPVKYDIQLQY